MRASLLSVLFASLAIVTFASTGCNDAAPEKDDHGHTHEDGGHDHGISADDHPAHGPNHGHIFELDSPDHCVEWCKFKDNDVIKMHVLDKEGKKATPVKIDSFVVTPMAGNDDLSFELKAEKPDDEGKSSVYMLDDKDLSIAIPLGVNIEIKMGDKTMKGKIAAHEPLDH